MAAYLTALLAWLSAPHFPEPLERAIEYVESRDVPWARNGATRGLWQVDARFSSQAVVRRHPWLLYVPSIGRAEGRLALAGWLRHTKSLPRALAAYNCGWGGLQGTCGRGYWPALLAHMRSRK